MNHAPLSSYEQAVYDAIKPGEYVSTMQIALDIVVPRDYVFEILGRLITHLLIRCRVGPTGETEYYRP